jgi:hypothetical protein
MRMDSRSLLGLALLLAASGGCSYHVFSPPARVFHLESAAPARPGETIVGARGGVLGGLFEPGAALGSANVRHGVAPNVEVNAEGTYGHVLDDGEAKQVNKNAGAARVGVKAGNPYAAVTGGLGGGITAMGGFGAADLGGILSYANCYVVPFLGASALASTPLGSANTIAFDNGRVSRPGTAFGWGAGLGLEIPLDHARCFAGATSTRIQLGANSATLWGKHTSNEGGGADSYSGWEKHGFFGFGVGLEVPLSL